MVEDGDSGDEFDVPSSGLSMSRDAVVAKAREIAEEYFSGELHLRLTVRQLYYQFVARGLLGSGQLVYKKIVSALSEARLEGRFPMHLIEDRGRDAQAGESTLCEDRVDRAIAKCERTVGSLADIFLRYDRWYGQETFVSVWVEKEALAGVFEAPCSELGVGLFACRGYPSVSALYQWLRHLCAAVTPDPVDDADDNRRSGRASRAVILYFGDHDPDGFEIPRSAMRNLERLAHAVDDDTNEPLLDWPGGEVPEIRLTRVALNMDQVRRYDPPPFEAKVTSSRCAGYKREHRTDRAWELDALEPTVLQQLIHASVAKHWSQATYDARQNSIAARRAELKKKMAAGGWFEKAIGAKR